jgi:2-keto-3-deoxy-L-rhamnonate aldolase RhmA
MVLIGPADLTAEMGIVGEFGDERFTRAVETVAEACRKNRKVFGLAGIKDAKLLGQYAPLGLRFVNVGNDTAFLQDAARAKVKEVRAIPLS